MQAYSRKKTEVQSELKVRFIPHCLLFHCKANLLLLVVVRRVGDVFFRMLYIYLMFPLVFLHYQKKYKIQRRSLHFSEQTGFVEFIFLFSNPSHTAELKHAVLPHFSSCFAKSPIFRTLLQFSHFMSRSLQMLMRALAVIGAILLPEHRFGQVLRLDRTSTHFFSSSHQCRVHRTGCRKRSTIWADEQSVGRSDSRRFSPGGWEIDLWSSLMNSFLLTFLYIFNYNVRIYHLIVHLLKPGSSLSHSFGRKNFNGFFQFTALYS